MVEEKEVKDVQNGKVNIVKSQTLLSDKDKLILIQLKQNPEGLRIEAIRKLTNIPKRTIYRILNEFEEKKVVINEYPVWKPNNGQSDFWQSLSEKGNIFELHNLGYVIELINKPEWWNRRKSRLIDRKSVV